MLISYQFGFETSKLPVYCHTVNGFKQVHVAYLASGEA